MFQVRHALLSALLVAGFALLGGCGGGGGGAPAAGGAPGSGGAGVLAGVLNLATNGSKAVTEVEPNDTLGQPDDLGPVLVGHRLTIFGHVDASSDPMDGFRLRCPQRAVVDATFSFSNAAANDLSLVVYDPTSLQPVEVFPVPATLSQVSFVCRATFDLVVTALTGATDYRLDLVFQVVPTGLTEREPNDGPAQGQYTGALFPGENLSLFGSLLGADVTDVWLVPFPLAATLGIELRYPAFNRFDLEILDGTNDVASPAPLVTFDGSGPSPRLGSMQVAAGRLLVLRVRRVTGGGGSWQLLLTVTPPTGGSPKFGAGEGRRPAPLAREAERLPGLAAPYGRVAIPLAAGEILVRCADEPRGDASASLAGAQEVARVPSGVRKVRVPLAPGLTVEEAARATVGAALALDGAPGVRYAEPNGRLQAFAEPDDVYFGLQWHYEQIHLPDAWELTTGNPNVIVAVLDTGITAHPDLAPRCFGGYDLVSDPGSGGDGDGVDPDPTDADLHGSFHGTHVAGTIGAVSNNGEGVAGVTWSSQIMPVRVLGEGGSGTYFDVAQGVLYAARLSNASGALPPQRAHVINMSLGGAFPSQTLADACLAAHNAGVVVVAAAGNDYGGPVSYPGAHAGVIAVGATDALATRAVYSNVGAQLDLMAPGGDVDVDYTGDGYADGVLSTMWDDFASPPSGTYLFLNGTSMAAPHVAGVAALVIAASPTITPSGVETLLKQTANDLGPPGPDTGYGFGLVDAYRALATVLGIVSGPPKLHLDVTSTDFGTAAAERNLLITNLGEQPLVVNAPTVLAEDGGAWLTASLTGGSASSNATGLRLVVDRTGLDPGGYGADVSLTSNGGSWNVHVTMVVVAALPPLPPLPLRLFVTSVVTGQVERFVDIDANHEFAWTFPAVPPGSYLLTAGTDLDHDGFYNDDGEYVGAWPTFDQPQVIVIQANQTIPGLRLPVFPKVALDDLAR